MSVVTVHARSAKSARISPDRIAVGVGAILLVSIIMLTSYVFSFTALRAAAVWTGVPEWATYLAPIFLDGALLTYSVSRAVFKWRGELVEARRTLGFLFLFTSISVAVNAAHAAAYWNWNFNNFEAWFGVLIGISAPIAALISAEEVVRLSFSNVQPSPLAVEPHVATPLLVEEVESVDEGAEVLESYEAPEDVYDPYGPPHEPSSRAVPEFNLLFGKEGNI